MTAGLVSAVIPTRNMANTVGETIRSIRGQTYHPIEIIVVDSHSTDGTRRIAEELADKVYDEAPGFSGVSGARDLGVRMASGEYILHVDADMRFPPQVVEEAVGLIEGGARAVATNFLPDPAISFWAKVRYAEWSANNYSETKGLCLFRRRDYLAVGGQKEGMVAGDDHDLMLRFARAGIRATEITDTPIVHLGEPRKLADVVRKNVSYGRTLDRFFAEEGYGGALAMSPVRKTHLTHLDEFARGGPLVFPGFLVYQYVKYASAVIGLMSSSLSGRF